MKKENLINLNELCQILSISEATGQNWIKQEKIIPNMIKNNSYFFSNDNIEHIKNQLFSESNNSLKSRRNKKYISGNYIYKSYLSEDNKNIHNITEILNYIYNNFEIINDRVIKYILAECSIGLFVDRLEVKETENSNFLLQFLDKKLDFGNYNELIMNLIDDSDDAINFCKKNEKIFNNNFYYEENEDVLGFIYSSLNNIGDRKSKGSYFTPTKVVRNMISKLDIKLKDKILDPCCGTGNFLINLPDDISLDNIYGIDIDEISVLISRINIALKFNTESVNKINEHILIGDFLKLNNNIKIDYIIGNPPWGYDFSNSDKNHFKQIYKSANLKNIESFNLFLEKALNILDLKGRVSFILPESILNVKSHFKIRECIMDNSQILSIEYLGNIFDNVHCPSIILNILKTDKGFTTKGIRIIEKDSSFVINSKRKVTSERFNFLITDKEDKIIEGIKKNKNITYLKNNAVFGLGIVTGNNNKFISNEKHKGFEKIIKGTDLKKYKISNKNQTYIKLDPEKLQQMAPVKIYRAEEKLLYRFINKDLVFAYDDDKHFTLNSCNILIPKIKGLDIKYIMAVLNSRILQFIFKKEFNSTKVLKSHLEQLPIPMINKEKQRLIISLVDRIIKSRNQNEYFDLYNKIDLLISETYKLSDEDYFFIKKQFYANKQEKYRK